MTADTLFNIFNTMVLPAWLLLIIAPKWRWTQKIVHSGAICICVAYSLLVFLFFTEADGDFSTLDNVGALFQHPYVLLAGWLHYLAFDLFIGAWQVRDAQRKGIHNALMVPSILLTLFFGPLGLLSYFIIRWTSRTGNSANPITTQ